MSIGISKQSAEWLLIKAWLNTKINEAHAAMEFGLTLEEYSAMRGRINLARLLIEEIEPTTPPQTKEEDYGISSEDRGYE